MNFQLPKIKFTGEILFENSVDVRLLDINVGQHLSNDKVLNFITENHAKFYLHEKCSIGDIHGLSEVFSATYIRYKKEVKYPEILTVGLGVYDITNSRVYFYHVIKDQQGNICHEAIIETVYINLKTGKISSLSSELKTVLKQTA